MKTRFLLTSLFCLTLTSAVAMAADTGAAAPSDNGAVVQSKTVETNTAADLAKTAPAAGEENKTAPKKHPHKKRKPSGKKKATEKK